ncbi:MULTISPECIES: sigma-54-dependent Fis family transcriptional regulator [unclassified Fusibacter]|uniref:sigma-54 interaction domain-containing protein n=1 Tax=unclassified Fusibacter TaxID=2624464 RepID=UPI001011087C|nr:MULTISPECIES: sigma 54-interacting transcriptional regulator [unclassified Fusibacter]MCK8059820.1 sigma 54-interacting transcriptional regulator [Fusibacter sp. A2]NPE21621.1 sigma 54-interacting transcriptional regulator [Fusibacter sp. A1]RXV62027.1 AAA family ATPase [Fusibacter sp. A1]
MVKKSMTIVAGSMNTARAIHEQLKEHIKDQAVTLLAYENGICTKVSDDLVLLSSELTKDDLLALGCFDENSETIIAGRTINYDFIDQIVSIPSGTPVLLVNDVPETATAMIDNLISLGIDHLEYQAFCPGMEAPDRKFKVAVTPGEPDKVPESVELIYDIGPRLLDFSTVTNVLMSLDTLGNQAGRYSSVYLQKIIKIAKRLAASRQEIEGLNSQLNRLIDSLKEGLMVIDETGRIKVMNEYALTFFNSRHYQVIGKMAKDVIYNAELLEFIYESSGLGSDFIEIEGHSVAINKMKTKTGEYILSFRRPESILEDHMSIKQEFARRGYTAKYQFENIIGKSAALTRAKTLSKKLAKSELTILFHGESGTGKELFASSIHRESARKNGPFLAINFSSLPDELVESELFGYEEGAFTGAKKGGKAGLFEQADSGTIFLDEIGDVSPKVQARLLRVLQEGEIMRVGGNEIKRIDVRIVAATNKDLALLVSQDKFREDLYYRLQMGYIKLPPLRDRKEDLRSLIEHHLHMGAISKMSIDEDVIEIFKAHNWPGNVRELKNCLGYMSAVSESNQLTTMDLPEYLQHVQKNTAEVSVATDGLAGEELFILKAIALFEKRKEACGREKLATYSIGTAFEMTKYQMRNRLEHLKEMNLISLGRGKVGAKLTERGRHHVMTIK